MQALIMVIHVIAAIAIIVLVLLQHGKGADAGAAFGSGGSNTMFGSAGAMSFFMKLTALCAAIFFATSLALSYLAAHHPASGAGILGNFPAQAPSTQPQPQPQQPEAPNNQ